MPKHGSHWRGHTGREKNTIRLSHLQKKLLGDFQGWTNLAMLYVKTGFYPEARSALQRAEKIAPSDRKVGVLIFAGIEYEEMSDREQVMRIYQELKVSDPKAAEWFFKACVLP